MYFTLCTSILESRFSTKDIRLTQFVPFEVLGVSFEVYGVALKTNSKLQFNLETSILKHKNIYFAYAHFVKLILSLVIFCQNDNSHIKLKTFDLSNHDAAKRLILVC